MRVTGIEKGRSQKYDVYLNDQLVFSLYKGELRQYQIQEGDTISDSLYQKICHEVLEKRARARCLHLLDRMDRTESQLFRKLQEGNYPEEVIESVLASLRQAGYVDDERYARQFISTRVSRKSCRILTRDLMQRGISKDLIERVLEEGEEFREEREVAMILTYADKRKVDPETATREELTRFYRFLMSKGFDGNTIQKGLRQLKEKNNM